MDWLISNSCMGVPTHELGALGRWCAYACSWWLAVIQLQAVIHAFGEVIDYCLAAANSLQSTMNGCMALYTLCHNQAGSKCMLLLVPDMGASYSALVPVDLRDLLLEMRFL
jgi:hypothetical protein